MTKYLIKRGFRGMFKVGDNIDIIDYINTNIDWIYIADEDGVVTYITDDGSNYEVDVKEGDLVIQFYENDGVKNPLIVIDNQQWKDNVEGAKQAALERASKIDACKDCDECSPRPAC